MAETQSANRELAVPLQLMSRALDFRGGWGWISGIRDAGWKRGGRKAATLLVAAVVERGCRMREGMQDERGDAGDGG